jgi:hypothetical protein
VHCTNPWSDARVIRDVKAAGVVWASVGVGQLLALVAYSDPCIDGVVVCIAVCSVKVHHNALLISGYVSSTKWISIILALRPQSVSL